MLKGYKTLLLNGAIIIGIAALKYLAGPDVASALTSHPNVAVGLTALANFGLRFLTNTPVGSKA